jgi:uncharacterized protein (TIGR02246 family)
MARPQEEQAIRSIETLWDDAWNRHDSDALADLLADDVDFINVTGAWFRGREEFRKRMTQTHQGVFKDSQRRTLETSVRFLTPDIAVVHARWEMRGLREPDDAMRPAWQGVITRVVQRQHGRWLVVAAHNVDVAEGLGRSSRPAALQ